jgi:RimJ/RimL family protein N-acetyltransferase
MLALNDIDTTVIRAAGADDAAQIWRYIQDLADEPVNNTRFRPGMLPTLADIQQEIAFYRAQPNALMLVAEADDQIAGLLYVIPGSSILTQHKGDLSINVHSAFRGQGIGSRLLREALDWAQQRSTLRRLTLTVLTRNEGAARLYQRLGFYAEGCLEEAYFVPDEGIYTDAIVMAYPLRHN